MTKFRKHLLIGITALGLGAGSFAALAAGPDCHHRMGGKHMSAEDRGKFEARMKERAAKRQAQLHDKLKLTPAQEPAWKAYAERVAVERGARPVGSPPDQAGMKHLSAPERMEQRLAMMKEHEKRMSDRLAAMKEFYAVLTPEQQKIFNDESGKGRHHGHQRHHNAF